MARTRLKIKGRRESGSFLALPHAVGHSERFGKLSPRAVKLLIDVGLQFNGHNNGDLSVAFRLLKKRGWRSRSGIDSARHELVGAGFLQRTRCGGRHKAALYALTWLPINECGGKLDVPATRVASGFWKCGPPAGQCDPPAGQSSGPNPQGTAELTHQRVSQAPNRDPIDPNTGPFLDIPDEAAENERVD